MTAPLRRLGAAVLACACLGGAVAAPARAQDAWRAREARDIVTVRHDLRAPGGVAWDAVRERLVVLDADGGRTLALDSWGDPVVDANGETAFRAAHATLDAAGGRFVWVDETTHEAVISALGDNGLPVGSARRVRLPWVAPIRVAGIAVGDRGELHVLDRLARRLHTFSAAAWTGERVPANAVRTLEIADVGAGELRGLAFDATAGRFYTIAGAGAALRLVEFDASGAVTRTADLEALHLRAPAGMAVAPSGDPTDDPGVQGVYVADPAHRESHGAVIEIKLRPLTTGVTAGPGDGLGTSATYSATHVRTVKTSAWSPPSPDPSGVTWDPVRQRLLISDGEVEEMSIYRSVNWFECSLTGTLLSTANTTRFSDEPVGVSRTSNRVIVADDDKRLVFLVNVGADGRVGGSDDTWTSFDTRDFGCGDPEGAGYDIANNVLVLADGLGEEVWVVRAGSDGRVGSSDDVVTHFDTGRLSIHDPEGIEFDPVRGTIWVMDSDGDAIVETNLSGTQLNRLDISGISLRSPAGLTLGPHSGNSAHRSFYIVCRGTDNDSDSRENDGTLTEVTASFLANSNTGGGGGGGGEEPPPPSGNAFAIGASSDDAEQQSNGSVVLSSSDIELVTDGSVQIVGLRFPNVTIAKNATIQSAYIQFTADAQHTGATVLAIEGQAIDNAPTFTSATNNVSSRSRVAGPVAWTPPSWTTTGEAGAAQRTPDLKTIVQQIVNRSGWASGNAMAFIITGSGRREAVAYDGDPTEAAVLHIELAVTAPTNQAPLVDAGTAGPITLPSSAALDGTVSDDGLPSNSLTVAWSKESGPGTVTFGNSNAVDTPASFSQDGTYTLRLTASDGALSASDLVTVVVNPEPTGGGGGGGGTASSWRIASSSDDAEQGGSAGTVNLTSSDLELTVDGSKNQTVGMRFTGVNVPKGATIARAWIQFTADASHSGGTTVTIQGQAADNPATFNTSAFNVSSRTRTTASAVWAIPSWTEGGAGTAQRSPELKTIVQQIVDRAGWNSGNAMAFIVTGNGVRAAVSFDGEPADAATLHIELGTGSTSSNRAPEVDAGADASVVHPNPVQLDGTVTDDGEPDPTPSLSWSHVGGTGTGAVSFANPSAAQTQASFGAPGSYQLRLTADDGELTAHDDVTITVTSPVASTTVFERRVAANNDDAEEMDGDMDVNSTDLELGEDGDPQLVGLRFRNVTIPARAPIAKAWVQFTVDEQQSVGTDLRIAGQAADNPTYFGSSLRISTRPRTSAWVGWSPAAWTQSAGTAGAAQRTPDLSPVIQEIVDRSGWRSGNAMVLIVDGTGHRTARSHNAGAATAPLLHVEYGGTTAMGALPAADDDSGDAEPMAHEDGAASEAGDPAETATPAEVAEN